MRDVSAIPFFVSSLSANVPYITTVGATMGPESGNPEVVCQSDAGSIITSGGGFSRHFDQPSYQAQAVKTYLSTGPKLPPTSMFNAKGRGYPDVASLGNAYNVVIGGNTYQVSGTSAASPVFCAMVTLVNGDREVNGKSPLGFLNPVLYKVDKSVYNDITSGENQCCAGQGNPVCCQVHRFLSFGKYRIPTHRLVRLHGRQGLGSDYGLGLARLPSLRQRARSPPLNSRSSE